MNAPYVPHASPQPLPEVAEYLARFRSCFGYRQTWESVERYVTGLLTDLPRKNCDVLAAVLATTSLERLQHLLTDAPWDPTALDRARVTDLITASAPGGVLVLDDTGLPKQGTASVGVARQYSGTLGKKGNCQVLVSAQYVEDTPQRSDPVHWPITARLYLPEAWTTDPVRCARAHVPADVVFQTKLELAIGLVDQALAWGVPFSCVVSDAGYGDTPSFLADLEARDLAYVCGVAGTFGVRLPAEVAAQRPVPPQRGPGHPRKQRPAPLYSAEALIAAQPACAWRTIIWRTGSDGAVLGRQVLALRVHRATGTDRWSVDHRRVSTGPEGWLIGERPLSGAVGQTQWYYSNLPADTSWERLASLAHQRWVIEHFYEDAKGECGLDDYQGRSWGGLHRHVALCMLAYSFLLTHRRAAASASVPGGFPPLCPTPEPARGPSDRHPVAV